jgi:hypothetical protein
VHDHRDDGFTCHEATGPQRAVQAVPALVGAEGESTPPILSYESPPVEPPPTVPMPIWARPSRRPSASAGSSA